MQSDVEMMFAFLFRTVAACHKTHPVGAGQQAADSPASLRFSILPPWWGTHVARALHLPPPALSWATDARASPPFT